MSLFLLRLLERVHGHLGWLAFASLLHPAILLSRPHRRATLAVVLATATTVLTACLGATIYPSYRVHVKQQLFIETPSLGWLFERKEHFAVGATCFALIGCIMHVYQRRVESADVQTRIARLAHRAYVFAAALALMVCVIGVLVASARSF